MIGIDGPNMSASIKPTFAPILLNPIAIFDEIVDLPTPPLPEVIAIIFFILLVLNFFITGLDSIFSLFEENSINYIL